MSHTDPSTSPTVQEEAPSRIVGVLLLLAASTTGVLAALLMFTLFSDPASGKQSSNEKGPLASSQAPDIASAREATGKESGQHVQQQPGISEPASAVVSERVPLEFDVGMRAISVGRTSDAAALLETATPLGVEALLPADALTRDPLDDLGVTSLREEVTAALTKAGAVESVGRPKLRDAVELARDLEHSTPELELDRRTLESLMKTSSDDGRLQAVVARLDEIRGLPFRWGDQCHSDDRQAEMLVHVPSTVRRLQNMARSIGSGSNAEALKRALNRSVAHLLDGDVWREPSAIPALEQVFQIEDDQTRLALVKKLGEIYCQNSTDALVRRALFDLDREVRQAAVEQLDRRPRDEYVDALLEGFRYPWEPVAWNAADAVVQLEARDAAADLMELLNAPDPGDPYVNVRGNWAVKEVVAVNHLKNCQLCHTQSVAASDTVRGIVPVPGQAMPQLYYASRNNNFQFVRADVTYLKQDFSVVLEVSNHGPWPKEQRFDYFVRERELKGPDAPTLSGKPDGELKGRAKKKDYGQRRAVVYALQQLVAEDPPPVVSTAKMVERPIPSSL